MNAMTNLVGWISAAHPPMPQNTPHVRHGYKQTEVGVIPEDWEVKSLGELATTVASGRSKSNATNGNYAVHGSTGVIAFSDTPEYKGDAILVARVGANAGKMNVVSGEYGVTDNTIIVRFGSGSCLPFFWRQMESKNLNSLVFGSGQPLITGTQLKALAVCVPPLPEQRAIGTALSDVDALLAAQDKLIAKKRDIKQAAMQRLLTGKQRLQKTGESGELIVDSDGNPVYFSGEWEVKTLGDLLAYEQPTQYLVNSSKYSDANDIPVLTAGKTFILGYTNEDDGIFNNIPVIIFDDFTTATQFVTFPFKAKSSAMKLLKPRNPSVNLRLVYEMMQLVEFKLSEHKRYWISEFQQLELKIPGEKEQTAITQVLSDMDADLAALEQQRDKTCALKQGMMQVLLTGKIRLV